MNVHDKKTLIYAVQWYWGYSNKKAQEYIKKANEETKKAILEGYRNQVVKMFYND